MSLLVEPSHQVSERQFQATVIEVARYLGWSVYFTWHSIHSPSGFPDLVLVRPPRVIFAELKSEHGRFRPDQLVWRDLLLACPGVEWVAWKPRDWPAIQQVLAHSDG